MKNIEKPAWKTSIKSYGTSWHYALHLPVFSHPMPWCWRDVTCQLRGHHVWQWPPAVPSLWDSGPTFCRRNGWFTSGHGSKPWYPNVNIKIDGIYGCSSTQIWHHRFWPIAEFLSYETTQTLRQFFLAELGLTTSWFVFLASLFWIEEAFRSLVVKLKKDMFFLVKLAACSW